ncbi:ferredoxin reductase family protein [Actinomadura parmotrematis]|uniref:Ferric reductase-like transmembrane domain-containing protein n=1 Tax=Actinomadura parmotrematis TaxID=2864039 RepID=A0ABS7FLI4_9ACTN|nr:ferric reductase-like transmembrane domain-containing protein [Actinomadura parmotrematis]MBW8481221.1 ferric reductase-like transmembrane domain-containing protein [Actinomadura parmotrematis]
MTATALPRPPGHHQAPPPGAAGPRPAPRWYGDAAGTLAWLTLLAVTVLWVHGGGVQQLAGGAAQALSSLGRITGLWASDLLLLQVLLMARIPLVERAFGQDRLARWHRWTGFASFHLMAAHIVLIVVGYALAGRANVLAEVWDMVTTYPGMLLAAGGTAALALVAATSVRAARRRLRYESWHLLHLYAYLGAGLALPHQLWTGTDFVSSAPARLFWWTLYGAAAGAVVVWRLALPAYRNLRHRLVVSHVVPEGPGLTSVYLRGRDLDRLPVRAGQFFQWRFLDGPGWSRAHPYSLSATPRDGLMRITVKDLGDGSARAASLEPGTRVLVEGPYGTLTGESYTGGPVVMLACGVGITPLIALLRDLPYAPGEATLIYRARSEREMAFGEELRSLAEARGVRVVHLLGPRAGRPSWLPGHLSYVGDADALRRMARPVEDAHVYICGPREWTAAARSAALEAGVRPGRLHTERFAW